MSYQNAKKYVEQVTWGEKIVWRLPARDEAQSLLEAKDYLPAGFANTVGTGLWTDSRNYSFRNPNAYAVHLNNTKRRDSPGRYYEIVNDPDEFYACLIRSE